MNFNSKPARIKSLNVYSARWLTSSSIDRYAIISAQNKIIYELSAIT